MVRDSTINTIENVLILQGGGSSGAKPIPSNILDIVRAVQSFIDCISVSMYKIFVSQILCTNIA
jgi:hypothetical protein